MDLLRTSCVWFPEIFRCGLSLGNAWSQINRHTFCPRVWETKESYQLQRHFVPDVWFWIYMEKHKEISWVIYCFVFVHSWTIYEFLSEHTFREVHYEWKSGIFGRMTSAFISSEWWRADILTVLGTLVDFAAVQNLSPQMCVSSITRRGLFAWK